MPSKAKSLQKRKFFKNKYAVIVFLFPNFLGFMAFSLLPVISTFVLSMFNWSLLTEPKYVGFKNFTTLFSKDPLFGKVLLNTFNYVIFYVGLNIIISLLLAVWLNQNRKGMGFFRAMFFIPVLVPPIAFSMIWRWIYAPDFGLLNTVLHCFGIQGPNWLGDTKAAMAALIITSLMQYIGYNMMIFTAGLQGVNPSLYEAASIDGASKITRFFHITLPIISPTIFFVLLTQLIRAFQTFDHVYILTNGGPGSATEILGLYLYHNAFIGYKLGYGAAISVIMFVFILAFTILQLVMQRKWVYYDG
ncbi:MAG: sugar ABC transporter permease [Clostridiaceae bacterium]